MPRKKTADPRSIFHLRLSQAERAEFKSKAQSASLTTAEFIRRACRDVVINSLADKHAIAAEMRRRNFLLANIASNLNQVARHVNIHKDDADLLFVTAHLKSIDLNIRRSFDLPATLLNKVSS